MFEVMYHYSYGNEIIMSGCITIYRCNIGSNVYILQAEYEAFEEAVIPHIDINADTVLDRFESTTNVGDPPYEQMIQRIIQITFKVANNPRPEYMFTEIG